MLLVYKMRPLSKKISKNMNRKHSKKKSLYRNKRFSRASSTTLSDLENIDQKNEKLAKHKSSWNVEPKDSVEVYKDRRRHQKKESGRIEKKGKSKENRRKVRKKSIKRKKHNCSCGQRSCSRDLSFGLSISVPSSNSSD